MTCPTCNGEGLVDVCYNNNPDHCHTIQCDECGGDGRVGLCEDCGDADATASDGLCSACEFERRLFVAEDLADIAYDERVED